MNLWTYLMIMSWRARSRARPGERPIPLAGCYEMMDDLLRKNGEGVAGGTVRSRFRAGRKVARVVARERGAAGTDEEVAEVLHREMITELMASALDRVKQFAANEARLLAEYHEKKLAVIEEIESMRFAPKKR
jgi:hypothetical protein